MSCVKAVFSGCVVMRVPTDKPAVMESVHRHPYIVRCSAVYLSGTSPPPSGPSYTYKEGNELCIHTHSHIYD